MKQKELRIDYVLMPALLLSGLAVVLLVARIIATGTVEFWFLNWNLLLAWLPMLFAWLFLRMIQNFRLKTWQVISPLILWLLFLPNSFYIVTDFVHLEPYQDISLAFDIIMFMSYTLAGLMLGVVSTFLIHQRLRRRLPKKAVRAGLLTVFALSSLAIYYGRVLGWNSWDVLTNPAGLLLDTADRIIHPIEFGQTYTFSLLFFVYITIVYTSFYYTARMLRNRN